MKKIVQFPNGQYAYRKWTLFGYAYLDLKSTGDFWWHRYNYFFYDCLTDDLDVILQRISYGDPI